MPPYNFLRCGTVARLMISMAEISLPLVLATLCFISSFRALYGTEKTHMSAASDRGGMVWRSEKSCGLNCLYVLLGTYAIPVDYERLTAEEMISSGANYTSLTNLKLAAKHHGLTVVLGKTDPLGLMSLPKPIVAHLDMMNQQGGTPGHFVLVLNTTSEGIEFMDGTSGVIRGMSWREFQRSWSGYVMYVPRLDPHFSAIFLFLSILGGASIGALLDRYFLRNVFRRIFFPPQLHGVSNEN